MKYVLMMHSHPGPWGHPTSDFLAEYQEQSSETRQERGDAFDRMLDSLQAEGELVHAEALAAPSAAKLLRWQGDAQIVTDVPYAETREQLAGFFVLDVASEERALEVARAFSGPGETVELRPVWG